ncbi:uncharacterized protein Z519_07666 [Cladophialophora bantiana CBS 173.52]|uniref:FAD/NAD(P)-binding domain-containing protein n=1 Tax=Cladophialophora bantiana (strain ATCC 10958 / CBS 173.52 / CDC B-1940 / NIH 8579) TaxID=1442370 RepID=A0A0D2HEH9_CLAB1|nr:uncharacterized protein Z519_07666 [Cladophialophora bantiana CBS 173.52]KIW91698.1 hypothetical protein Z519_07666 [Cladophialophora bantiana CBS 173.52]
MTATVLDPKLVEAYRDAKIPKVVNPIKLAFDPEALKRRYIRERDKRAADVKAHGGINQFQLIETDGPFADYLRDSWVEPGFKRDPVDEQVDVFILGGGYSAQIIAARLLEKGITNLRIVEKAGDFGGTWYWNRFPGAQCDVESYIYMPLLEETGFIPTEKYARAKELLAHSERIGRHYGLYEKALFQTEALSMHWDDDTSLWTIQTSCDDKIRAKFVIPCSGPLHRPKLPGIPGMERFKGKAFHSSRWDYDYTGGDSDGNLNRLADKRVGIIGTGATAVQIVPHLGQWAKEVFVFQRTPSSIGVRGNKKTDPAWVASLTPGWQQRRNINFNNLCNGIREPEDMVQDGWTNILPDVFGQPDPNMTPEEAAAFRQLVDYEKMEAVRARCDKLVKDPATAEALKPWYNIMCKRPCFHDEYLQTFNRPNVHLIDTAGKSLEGVDETGVLANGQHYEVDVIIYATGFEKATSFSHRANMELYGRGGLTLTDAWGNGPRTLHGYTTRNFPNCFFIHNIQSTLTPNFLFTASETSWQLVYLITECLKRGIKSVEPTAQAEEDWVNTILKLGERSAKFYAECTPGYYNNEGTHDSSAAKNAGYGGGAPEFMQLMRDWRAKGDMAGLDVRV